jgi:PAS domain S-box-containing protein
VIEATPAAIIGLDLEGKVRSIWNPAAEKMLGWSAQEAMGKFLPSVPLDKEDEFQRFRDWIRNGKTLNGIEVRRNRRDGTPTDYSIYASPLYDTEGRITGNIAVLVDITERKQAEKALKDTALRLNEAQRIAHIGNWELDLKNNVLIWSDEIFRIFEIDPEKFGASYEAFLDAVHPGDKETVNLAYTNSLKTKKPYSIDHRLLYPGGRIKHVHEQCETYFENDQPIRSVGTVQDITERKIAEKELRKREMDLREAQRLGKLGSWDWDATSDTITWSEEYYRIYGFDPTQPPPGYIEHLKAYTSESAALLDAAVKRNMETGDPYEVDLELACTDGPTKWITARSETKRDATGQITGLRGTAQDITVRKQMEDELIRYRNHLEDLVKERTIELEIARNKAQQYLDIAGVILVAIDTDQRVSLINQKGCQVLGNTSDAIIGRNWFETFVPEEFRQKVFLEFKRLIAGEHKSDKYFENTVLTKSGEKRLIAWHNVLLRDRQGNITGTLSSGEDVTEQKYAEAQIRRLNRDLLDRAGALEAANNELDAFAYSVSHDLRAPLRHIDGFLELLQKKAAAKLDEKERHYMTAISESVKTMGKLIDDLLSFSRMGRQAMLLKCLELGEMVYKVIQELKPDFIEKKIHWQVGDLPTITGDASMLRIVLVNLISNAIKFTRPREQAIIEIGCQYQETEVVVFVRDNGVGFDQSYVSRLFGVFQRLHHTEEFEGTGVGLAIAQRIIIRHGGRIWAEGELGHGATFFFSLPLYNEGGH